MNRHPAGNKPSGAQSCATTAAEQAAKLSDWRAEMPVRQLLSTAEKHQQFLQTTDKSDIRTLGDRTRHPRNEFYTVYVAATALFVCIFGLSIPSRGVRPG